MMRPALKKGISSDQHQGLGCLISQRIQPVEDSAPNVRSFFSREFAHELGDILQVFVELRFFWVSAIKEHKQFSVHRSVVGIRDTLDAISHAVRDADNDFVQKTARALIAHAKRIQAALNQINIGQWPYTQTALCSFLHT